MGILLTYFLFESCVYFFDSHPIFIAVRTSIRNI